MNHLGIALVAMEEEFFANEGLTDMELITFDETGSELLDRKWYKLICWLTDWLRLAAA